MSKEKRVISPALVGIPIAIALIWSMALVGKGLWQLVRDRSQAEIPEKFAQVKNVATGVFDYGGSTAWAPLRLLVDSAIQAERPELQLRYVQSDSEPPGSRSGINMLLDGQLTFAQSSHPLREEDYNLATEKGFKLKQVAIAVDGLAIAVHPSLKISGLTIEQLRGIYSGQIVNWREVGGPDLAIVPYSRPVDVDGTAELFQEIILKDRAFSADTRFVSTTTEALRELANNPGGIYYASAALILPQCTIKPLPIGEKSDQLVSPYQSPLVTESECPNRRNRLNVEAFKTARYPLTRYLYVIIKQNGGTEEQVGEAYANFLRTSQGQKLISQAGLIPIP